MAGFVLKSVEFRREREPSWRELEDLVARTEHGGLSGLSQDEISRLPGLYRAALSSLSVARSISLDKELIIYLEGLTQRAYLSVYAPRHSVSASIRNFFAQRFPDLVRGLTPFLGVAFLVLVAGILTGIVLTLENPDRFYSFVDPQYAQGRGPLTSREELLEVLTGAERGVIDELGAFATFLFTNNATIGLLCYGLGFAAGVPVLLLVFTNGLILGAFSAIHTRADLSLEFWSWVLPHGVTELFAVCLCAAAGLSVGYSAVFPGRYRRRDQLARKGREAAQVVIGAVAMFFLAALIEGLFRQLVHSVPIRLTVAAASVGFWLWYFGPLKRGVVR